MLNGLKFDSYVFNDILLLQIDCSLLLIAYTIPRACLEYSPIFDD